MESDKKIQKDTERDISPSNTSVRSNDLRFIIITKLVKIIMKYRIG
jgi:hypothetical protein